MTDFVMMKTAPISITSIAYRSKMKGYLYFQLYRNKRFLN